MRKTILMLVALMLCATALAQGVSVEKARFHLGDQDAWRQPDFDDSAWPILDLDRDWTRQGVRNPNGYAWYRLHVVIPSTLKNGVMLDLGPIDDTDETWLNGVLVGKTGSNPSDPKGYVGKWKSNRRYPVDPSLVRWDQENVIAVRVYNAGDPGGFYRRPALIREPHLSDFVTLTLARDGGTAEAKLVSRAPTRGTVKVVKEDIYSGQLLESKSWKVNLAPQRPNFFSEPLEGTVRVTVTYTDDGFDEEVAAEMAGTYILTPPAPAAPRYNGPLVFGVRPGSPVIFRLAFSGEKPMTFSVEGLPAGVQLDADKGVLSGSVSEAGDYPLVLVACNDKGEARTAFTLKVGEDKIGLTPPMGWNSWNCWGLSVSQDRVMASALSLLNNGLADYGYSYINIDDAWEAAERNPDGTISPNEKFPDMEALGDWLHGNGLKMGIYSSPGDRTCGNHLGTLGHEAQDAATWNEWGVDYLKYDWCGYYTVFESDKDYSLAAYMRPYRKMQQFLRAQPRDIFYSLCQYGMAEVWQWGALVDANSWRTTGDITDTWESLQQIGFEQQLNLYPYAGPGHWNDPDMLVVGKVGWGDNLRDTRLTPDEQYTHISLWSLLAANMLIGCDLAQIDDFTFNLLCNNEVNAVNQDILGRQAHRVSDQDGIQIWTRELYDGGTAVGIFNLGRVTAPVYLKNALGKIGVQAASVRDLWRQKDIPTEKTYTIPAHGVLFIKVTQ